MNSFKNMNVCLKAYNDPFQTSASGFKSRTNRRPSAACLKMLTLAVFCFFLRNLVSGMNSRSRYSLLICVSDLTESVSAFMLSPWQ